MGGGGDSSTEGLGKNDLSPGPIYLPKDDWFGPGPHGIGPEFTMRPSHRVSIIDKKTTQAERPGPKYMLPNGLGKQVESTKRSFNVGKFSNSRRDTIAALPIDSPGPAAYNRGSLGLKTLARQEKVREKGTGMGGADRFFNKATRTGYVPGPGAYKQPTSVGGMHPSNKSMPVFAFGKDGARHAHSVKDPSIVDPCSPGPHATYKINSALGTQFLAARSTSAQYGFGTGSRFPVSPQENREHLEAIKKVRKRHEAILARREAMGIPRPTTTYD